jgi:small-conductance mechanosensitive channel
VVVETTDLRTRCKLDVFMSFENFLANEYVYFLTGMIVTLIIVIISHRLLKRHAIKTAGRRKKYAQYIIDRLSRPVIFLFFFSGLYGAMKPLSILAPYSQWIDSGFFVVLTLIFAFLASRIVTVLMHGFLKVRGGFEKTPGLLNKAVIFFIYAIAIVAILGYFKIDITPMLAGVGLGALAVGLALQSTLANFFAGLHLISDKPIEVSNYIEIDENTKGFVEDIGWRSTRIRTLADNLLIIPNAKLAESNITNFSKPKQDMSLWVPCGVAYEADLRKVERITLEVAEKIQQTVDGAVKDFEPMFRYKEFGDSNINFIAILRVEEPTKRFVVRNEFIKALKERFDSENIEISWPIVKIYRMK